MDDATHVVPLAWLRPGLPFVLAIALALGAALGIRWYLTREGRIDRFHRVTRLLEEAGLSVLFFGVLAVTCLQIFMRNLFHSGFIWTEPMARYLVLWIAFFGAYTATSRGRHLAIDIVALLLRPRTRAILQRVTALIAAGVCIALANGAYAYIRQEYEFGREAFLGMRTWVVQSILLFGFGMLAYRFLVATFIGYGPDVEPERPRAAPEPPGAGREPPRDPPEPPGAAPEPLAATEKRS